MSDKFKYINELELHYDMMKLFDELSLIEKTRKVMRGLQQPKDSGEYKYAKLQLMRLSAPIAAVVVPILILLLIILVAWVPAKEPVIEIEIRRPEEIPKLDPVKELEL